MLPRAPFAGSLLLLLVTAVPCRGAAPDRSAGAAHVDRVPWSLAGTWEFALGDPLTGVEGLDTLRFEPVRVPGAWQDSGIPGHGVGWYRTLFELDPAVSGLTLALAIEQIRDADEVYLDGQLVGRTGGFPPRYEKATLIDRVYELPTHVTTRSGPHLLAIRVYNPGPRAGGLTGEPFLDTVASAFWKRTGREAPRALLAAAIGCLGLFSLFFYLRAREQVDFLYYFLYTTGIAVYLATWHSVWAETGISLSLLFRVNCALAFVLFSLYLLFFDTFFGRAISRFHLALHLVQISLVLACLFWPRVDDLYHLLGVGYVAIVSGSVETLGCLVRDTRRRVPYARPVLIVSALLFLAVLHDMAQDLRLLGRTGNFRLFAPVFLLFTLVFLAVAADRFARMRVAASTDPLTGLSNRTVLFERINLEIARARRHQHPVALAVCDLDLFKSFNDRFGHVAGDRLLVAVAEALRASIRDTDLAVRYGGEEFIVLLPEANALDAMTCLERVRKAVSSVVVPGVPEGRTISIGLAVFDPQISTAVSVTAFLRQADGALYQAKSQGRDRIVVAEGNPPSSSGKYVLDSAFRRKRSSAAVPAQKG